MTISFISLLSFACNDMKPSMESSEFVLSDSLSTALASIKGDFDGDGIQEELKEKNIELEKYSLLFLVSSTTKIPDLKLRQSTVLPVLIHFNNVGDLNDDGRDEVTYVMEGRAGEENMFYMMTYIDDKWKELFSFQVMEGQRKFFEKIDEEKIQIFFRNKNAQLDSSLVSLGKEVQNNYTLSTDFPSNYVVKEWGLDCVKGTHFFLPDHTWKFIYDPYCFSIRTDFGTWETVGEQVRIHHTKTTGQKGLGVQRVRSGTEGAAVPDFYYDSYEAYESAANATIKIDIHSFFDKDGFLEIDTTERASEI